ncbi:hypothetical protein IM538_21560 [Cytobacillus suaedae]|nr:hypothetical protein IM538_21560 [Cytobacillus suaedae]
MCARKPCRTSEYGSNYFVAVVNEDLRQMIKSGQLVATTDYARIADVDAVAT